MSGISPGAGVAFNRASALRRANTGTAHVSGAKSTSALLNRAKSTNGVPISRTGGALTRTIDGNGVAGNGRTYGGPDYGYADVDSHSLIGEHEEEEEIDDREWGLEKGMELFEVSAKDDLGVYLCSFVPLLSLAYHDAIISTKGVQTLFDSLIGAIIEKKDAIEQENEMKKRDSVFLSSLPAWDAQAEEEEAREKAASSRTGGWSCCQT